ncbi:MAG TPA: hypothetical protein VF789_15750 [Thermoanaerobaculia bacterium]
MKKLFGLALVLGLCTWISNAAPAHASCVQICGSEYASCKLDCRFNPYPGCLNDCTMEYNACVAAC